MTITSTEERLAQRKESEPVAVEAVAADLPVDPGRSVTHPPRIWVDAEEAGTPDDPTDWTTRFALAKTLGGW